MGVLQAATLAALAVALAVPTVSAQAPLREIDQQVLLDDEGLVQYGGCPGDTCVPMFPADGIDLLSLDAREAFLPDGRPALSFRLSYDVVTPDIPGRSAVLSFLLEGKPKEFALSGLDAANASAPGSDLVVGPVSYEDGQVVEAWFAHETLSLQPGMTLEEIRVQSRTGSDPDDDMPGPWYSNGVAMPHVPHSADVAEAVEEHPPGSYVSKGPSPLIYDVKATPNDVAFPTSWTVTFSNPLISLNQSVTAKVANITGVVNPAQLVVGAGQTGSVQVNATDLQGNMMGQLVLESDYGGRAVVPLSFFAPPAKESPALPGLAIVVTLVGLAMLRRPPSR